MRKLSLGWIRKTFGYKKHIT